MASDAATFATPVSAAVAALSKSAYSVTDAFTFAEISPSDAANNALSGSVILYFQVCVVVPSVFVPVS